MSQADQGMALENLLKAKIDSLKQLKRVLDDEKQVLVDNDSEALLALTEKKSQLLKQINEASGQIEKCKQQLEANPAQNGELGELWQQFTEELRACQQQNLVNGTVIHVSLSNAKRMLALLSGKPPADDLYNKRGTTVSTHKNTGHLKA